MKKLKQNYMGITDSLSEMPGIRKELSLSQVPDYTTLCKAFGRFAKRSCNSTM